MTEETKTVTTGYLDTHRDHDNRLVVDKYVKMTIKDYVPGPPHECMNATGGSRCDICFGGLPYGKTVAELTLHGPISISPERRAELVEWLQALTKIVEIDTDYPAMKKTFTFYEGVPQ